MHLNSIESINQTQLIIHNLRENDKIKLKNILNSLKITKNKYYYSNIKKTNLTLKATKLKELTKQITKLCQKTKFRYGYLKIKQLYFINYNKQISAEKIRIIMKNNNLNCNLKKYKNKKPNYFKEIINPNLINNNFKATQPYQKLFTDFTEFQIEGKKIYYSAIIDSYNNQIIASKTSTKCNLDLAIKTFKQLKKPQNLLCYFHTDQGSIYKSSKFQNLLIKNNFIPSMSKKGTPKNNAIIENFFGHLKGFLKKPTIYKIQNFANFWNKNWKLQKLNFQTPLEFLKNPIFKLNSY